MRSLRIVALVAAVTLAAACSGGDDDDGAAASSTTAEPAATTADLEARLLTLEDLAPESSLDAAWLQGDVAEGVDIQLPGCVVEEPLEGAVGAVEAKFVRDTVFKLPSIEEDLAEYEGTGAADAFAAAGARYDGCTPEFVFEGAPSVGTVERLPLTLGGEQSAAWRISVTIAETAISITSIHVQQGDLELSLVHVDVGVPIPADLEAIAAKAIGKLS
jgi:hypothetical protein